MAFRWDDLQVFLAIHRARRLSEAGRALGVDPSTASRRLAALEDALGVTLFDRTPDGLLPTDAAADLLGPAELAEEAARQADAALAGYGEALEGLVRVALAEGFATHTLAPSLPAFYLRYPDIEVEIIASHALADLSRREADVAVRFVRPTAGDLVAKRLATGDYGVFASHAYAEAKGPVRSVDDLDWITWPARLGNIPEAAWFEANVHVAPRVRTESVTTMYAAGLAGAGVMLLPRPFVAGDPRVVEVPVSESIDLSVDVWLVMHRSLRHVPRVRAVWEFLESLVLDMASPREVPPVAS